MASNPDSLNQGNSPYFPALTGVRAIAAWMVFVHHFVEIPEKGSKNFFPNFFYEFHTGVTLFFVLSGFLIATRYYEKSKQGKNDLKIYFVNRFARIFPMFFLITTATFIAFAMHWEAFAPNGVSLGADYLLNISLLRGFFDDLWFSGISQGWTLTVEECFYLLAPLLFLLIRKNKIWYYLQPLVFLTIGFVLVSIFREVDFYGFFDDNRFMLLRTFFGRSTEFFIGIGLALWWMNKKNKKESRGWFTFGGIVLISACIVGLTLIKGNYEQGLYHPIGIGINNLVLPFCIALFFRGLITEKTILSQLLGTPLFQLLGKSSYTFYLIHFGLLSVLLMNYVTLNPGLIFILMNGIAIILFLLIEDPLNRWIRKVLIRKKNFRL